MPRLRLRSRDPMLGETRHSASLRQVPALGQKLFNRQVPNTFLHAQLIIEGVISDDSALPIHAVDAHPVAIAVGTNQAYFQSIRRNSSNRSLINSIHHRLDARLDKKN